MHLQRSEQLLNQVGQLRVRVHDLIPNFKY